MRKDSLLSSSLQSNTNKLVTGPVLSHQDVDLSEDSEDGPLYIFESCTFNGLVNPGNGGAITCSAISSDSYKPQLIIKQCSFNSCTSSSGHGGGVSAVGVSLCTIEQTLFFDCNATYGYAGGVYFLSGAGFPLLSDTSFISCYAAISHNSLDVNDGGGITISCSYPSTELHYIIQGCRFISCGCYDWGGGSYIYSHSAKLVCTDSLFSACTSATAEGMGINLGTTDAEFFIHFCYFACSTSSTPPTDVSINRYSNTFSSSPIFHSFSTKDPSKSVSTCVSWNNYQYRNWLPLTYNPLDYLCKSINNYSSESSALVPQNKQECLSFRLISSSLNI